MFRQSLTQTRDKISLSLAALAFLATTTTLAPLATAEEEASIPNPAAVAKSAPANPNAGEVANIGAVANPKLAPTPPNNPNPDLAPPPGRAVKTPGSKTASRTANLPPATFNLPKDCAILNKRSIFARNGVAASPTPVGTGSPEETLAVRGIVSDERSFFVFIENTASHQMMQLRPGDKLANGKVGPICLDDFNFETPGSSKRISVGQNLLGAPVPPPAPPQPPPNPQQGPPQEGPPKNAKPTKEPVYEIAPNGQRVRNVVAERAG